MQTAELILGSLMALAGVACLLYAFFAHREKGPLLVNDWILASRGEREKLDKKALYHKASRVFGALGAILLLVALGIWLNAAWVLWLAAGLALLLAVLVLVQFFREEAQKDKKNR